MVRNLTVDRVVQGELLNTRLEILAETGGKFRVGGISLGSC